MSASEHHPLDDLAKGLASGTISRRRPLNLIGTVFAGATLALIPGVASPPAHAKAGGRSDLAPPSHGIKKGSNREREADSAREMLAAVGARATATARLAVSANSL